MPPVQLLTELRQIRRLLDSGAPLTRGSPRTGVGGAAYLVSKAIRGSRLLAFEDLGMEAIYEFDVKDMPVTVAVDSKGTSVHVTGPAEWQQRIAGIPILQ